MILSLLFHLKDREKVSVFFLLLAAAFIYSFAALLDPFLNLWDERFHALVSKNLMNHPLMPTLYDEMTIADANYNGWDKTHIWLHKQPLFLWQIALSFKLFGISEFTLRIPGIILGVLLVFVGYRCGKLLVNQRTGYLTAILFISSNFIIELISGRQSTDHNDLSFVAYVSFSIWALIEYEYSKNKSWVVLIGIFSGFAILCKWLVGLLVYLGWLIIKLQKKALNYKKYNDVLISLLITAAIVLPWQVLIFHCYPAEASSELKYTGSHFFEILEGHSGDHWFYFDKFHTIFGDFSFLLIVPALALFYYQVNNKKMYFSFLTMILFIYGFFILAATKMIAFPFVIVLLIFITIASFLDYLFNKLMQTGLHESLNKVIVFILILAIAITRLDIKLIEKKHALLYPENNYSPIMANNRNIYKNLELPDNSVLFNVKGRQYVEAMFYTGLPAYNFIPTEKHYAEIKKKGKVAAIFISANATLPDYILTDKTVITITEELHSFD